MLGAVLAGAVLAMGTSPAEAAFPGANGKIVFGADLNGNQDIYAIGSDGSNRARLTADPAIDTDPAWSPDGTKIAFQSSRDQDWEVFVMDADGSNPTNLTNFHHPLGHTIFASDLNPTWSPDGTKIAFASSRDGSQGGGSNWEIYVMDADGSNVRNLTNAGPHQDLMPAWSPDGTRIAFQRLELTATGSILGGGIYLMDAVTGANQVNISNDPVDSSPAWSPDGARIAFSRGADVYIMNPDGSNQQRLTSGGQAAWSPDGTKLAFGRFNAGLFVANADGTEETAIASDVRFANGIDWQPVSDSDGDALPDEWETNPIDFDGDGNVDLDLPSLGADPDHKDIYVEVDTMLGHELEQAAIDLVIASFAAAPVANPDGTTGIRLHVDNGPNSPMDHTATTWGTHSDADTLSHDTILGAPVGTNDFDWAEFDTLKSANFQSVRARAFHYLVSAHQHESAANTSSGISRGIGAADLIVSLGAFCPPPLAECSGTVEQQAGTFMHELGHNLGLRHGGQDDLHRKPNYFSVMNYAFQFSGLVSQLGNAGFFDYSGFGTTSIGALDENALDEADGFGPVAANLPYYTVYRCPDRSLVRERPADNLQVDWNCDGTTGGVVNANISGENGLGVLTPYEDWPRLVYTGGAIGSAGAAPAPLAATELIEPSVTEILEVAELLTGDGSSGDALAPVTTASAAPASNAAGWNRKTVTVELSATDDDSGVRELVYSTGGAETVVSGAAASVEIAAEGITTLTYFARDEAGNDEEPQTLVVRIDRTAPDAELHWSPATREFVVTGVDALSGVAGVATAVTSLTKHEELRRYVVSDRAGNERMLEARVRERGKERLVVNIANVELDVDWRLDKAGSLRTLRQHARAGARRVDADYDAREDVTRLTEHVAGRKPQRSDRPGLVLLRVVSDGNGASLDY